MPFQVSAQNKVELVQLRHRYCHLVDGGEYEQWADLFTENGTFEIADGESYTGHDELVKYGSDVFDDLYQFQAHTVSNPVLDINADKGTGRWYLFMPHMTREGDPGLVQGRYADDYRRVGDEWKLESVTVNVHFRETLR